MLKFILLFFIAFSANATEIGYLIGSKHIGGGDYNENNPGLYVKHDNYIVGHYKNSYYDPATFVGKYAEYGRYSIAYGLIKGYGWNNGYSKGNDVLPFILPTIHFNHGINLHLLGNAVALSISYEF